MKSSIKKRVLFIDRDGTIVVEPPSDKQLDSLEKFAFVPGAISALKRLSETNMYELVMVSNQDGLGTSIFPEETFWPPHNVMLETLSGEGVVFKEIFIDRSFAEEQKPTRKPGVAMLLQYFSDEYDLSRSWVIGDRKTDIELAQNLGAQSALIGSSERLYDATMASQQWGNIADGIINSTRASTIQRVTTETSINMSLNLDGVGSSRVSTGIPFFDHMLNLFAYHARIDLELDARGDLPHHLIEDVGIVLGACLGRAIGSKIGINRYGFFILPMDESLAQVALDFSGRSSLKWNAQFIHEQVEGMPAEMFSHFFESIAQNAKLTLNISVCGENEHHKIEAAFKGFGKAIRIAVSIDPSFASFIPSTKGVL